MRLMTLPELAFRQGLGKGLGQKDRRPEIDVEMRLPVSPIERVELVPVETGGVVDQAGGRAERLGASLDQGRKRVQPGKIGGESGRFSALALDLRNERQGLGRGGAVMDADAPAASRQIERDGPAEPAARAGHEHGPGILVLSHAILLGDVAESNRQANFAADGHSK